MAQVPEAQASQSNMAESTSRLISRIDVRLPLSVRETIDKAAAMQGRTRTDFLIEAALEKAEAVISNQLLVKLALQDQELLAHALLEEKVEEPTDFIKSIANEYRAKVESK